MAATARSQNAMQRKYKKDLESGAADAGKDPIEFIRATCLSRGASGIRGLARAFQIIDDDGSKTLNLQEFTNGLKDFGIYFDTHDEYKRVFDLFDTSGDGLIDFDEFLRKLRPPMSKTRINLIRRAFSKLDSDKSGVVTHEDLKAYDVRQHPKYQNGEWDREQVLKEFLAAFETPGEADGEVTWDEFINYYAGVSASIDTDAYFTVMMMKAWKL